VSNPLHSSHLAVRTLISDTIKSIDDSILYAYARASDFNTLGKKEDKRVCLDPLKQILTPIPNGFGFTKTYQVALVFYKLDDKQGAEDASAIILDETDLLSDNFVNKLNDILLDEDNTDDISTQTVEITNVNKEPVIKVTADVCTGYILRMDLIVPDSFDYCSLYD
jgi:hypothetical protein